jgi:hypothetical protein
MGTVVSIALTVSAIPLTVGMLIALYFPFRGGADNLIAR